MLTTRELIEALKEVEDKDLPVIICLPHGDDYLSNNIKKKKERKK